KGAGALRPGPVGSPVGRRFGGGGGAASGGGGGALAGTVTAHMEHEGDEALPLVEAPLGPDGWATFGKAAGRSGGLSGAAELFPWMLDGAPAEISERLLGILPAPARLRYRALWRPPHGPTPGPDPAGI